MIKFMAWEKRMEAKVIEVRNKELKFQQRHYFIWVRESLLQVSMCTWRLTNDLWLLLLECLDRDMVCTTLVSFSA